MAIFPCTRFQISDLKADLQHHMYFLTLDSKLYAAPIPKEQLNRVLDLGTGTGIWAMDFGMISSTFVI